ncbi:MAG: nitrous oxide reductase family maturation protein NosD [Bacteroidales bacterium]|nr:nitrous oxide reductase family maturation protein NosD [Bacteroidales bacterium]
MKNILTALIFCLINANAYTQVIKVCPDCKINSIAQALKIAKNGYKILIEKGLYSERNIIIDKSIQLIGAGNPVIDGDNKGEIITIKADNVSISGFTIKNVGTSYTEDNAAIKVVKGNFFTISNNTLENVFFGITIEKSKHGIIENNNISSTATQEYNSGNGIHLWHCDDIKVKNNQLHGLRDGIYFEFVTNSSISGNISKNNVRYGLHFMFSNDNEYFENTFVNNGAGVAVMFSKNINMHHNKFIKNWGSSSYGLLLKEIYDAEITDNLFEQNTIGIHAEGSTRINYKKNNFINNGWAIKISGACYTNKFTKNNFVSNAFDVSYNSKLNDNVFDNNYWSEYAGYDLDKNGIGDVPFRPVKLFSYIANKTPETIVLLRSLFIDIINFSEKVSPVFTPDNLLDNNPLMQEIK